MNDLFSKNVQVYETKRIKVARMNTVDVLDSAPSDLYSVHSWNEKYGLVFVLSSFLSLMDFHLISKSAVGKSCTITRCLNGPHI